MKVKNLNGTSTNKCKCGSWLAHWERFSGKKAVKCAVKNCNNKAVSGGHVQLAISTDHSWYIIPLCIECNNNRATILTIHDNVPPVPANISETCG